MGLKEVLQKHGVPLRADFDERMDIVVSALRRSPGYHKKLDAYKKKQGGGADELAPEETKPKNGEDFLGPQLQTFLDVVTSPEARGTLQGLFAVLFFVSYLEKIPVFGSVLSAVLDLMIMGGKMLTKTVQKNLPPLIGLIPLPFASLVGLGLAALFGMLVWPVIAIVSFSRQDFTAAVESMIRVVPPPFGDTIADLFLEGNRAVARLNEKRKKIAADIAAGIELVSGLVGEVSSTVKEGADTLADKTKEAAKTGVKEVKEMITEPLPAVSKLPTKLPAAQPILTPETEFGPSMAQAAGRKRLSRRMRSKNKWRTRRHKQSK